MSLIAAAAALPRVPTERTRIGRWTKEEAPPPPMARWDFRESQAPYYTTAGDLPLQVMSATTPVKRTDSLLGDALELSGNQWLAIPDTDLGRLNIGGTGKTAVSIAAWVYNVRRGQTCVAGIWGETFDPPTRQYALFIDLNTYGGDDMSCFHVSKDGGPTPGYPYSTDYSANPERVAIGRWELHVGTYDGNQAVSYLNGMAYPHFYMASRTGDHRRNPYTFPLGLNATPEVFHVGSIADGSSNLAGMIHDLRVWDVALTPGQALYLSREHPIITTGPTDQPTVSYELTARQTIKPASSQTSWTFPDLAVGAPAEDRLILATLYGPAPSAVTIGGVAATVVPTDGGPAYAYAVVPAGVTATVVVSTPATTILHVALLRVTGAAGGHSAVTGTGVNTRFLSLGAAARGGLVVMAGRMNNDNVASFEPSHHLLFDRNEETNTFAAALGVGSATGYRYPIRCTATNGSAMLAASAIAFDPA